MRPAKREGKRVQEVPLPRMGGVGIALHRHGADRHPPDPGLEPADQLLVREHQVEVRTAWRRPHRVREAGEAFVQVREQRVGIEPRELEPPREALLQHLALRTERLQHPPPFDARALGALDEERRGPREDVGWGPVSRHEEIRCLELPARLRRVRRPALVIDHL